MLKSFRFLFQFAWINLACLLGFAVLVVVGCYATGVPGGASNLFATYYGAFPLVTLFVLFLFAFSLCTSNLNLGLSFGARRRDFFWAVQGVLVVYTGFCWAAQVLLAALPQLGGWIEEGRWTLIRAFYGGTLWVFPLVCLTILVLGCLGGLVSAKSKVWGAVILSVSVIALLMGSILLALMADLDAWSFLMGSAWSGMWGSLPAILTIGMLATLAIGEVVIWRQIFRFAVR
ncbi:Uncharacterised protein [uncultured Clostridium sp.]|uniref:hypothetical protein n=1 Tax=Flintibacter sp. P01028 TaxID=3342382 RepID=UPI00082156D8|nr:hypothetical protein [Clostridiales bacterium]SCH35353.1 Uncharacterised protein [uncultured Clostridium sp.]